MRKNSRLGYLLDTIPDCQEIIADIGADHGKLIVSALLAGKCKSGIAIDISEESLNKAKILAKEKKIDNRIEFYVGDGFTPIKNQSISLAIIAGMGGNEIVNILSQQHCCKYYILSPHQDSHVLRKYMMENDFKAIQDFIVFDKKYYPIILACKGKCDYKEEEIFLGKNFPSSIEYNNRNAYRKNYLENIIREAKSNSKGKKISNELLNEYEVLVKWQSLKK